MIYEWKGKRMSIKVSNSSNNVNSNNSNTPVSMGTVASLQRGPEQVSAPGVCVYTGLNSVPAFSSSHVHQNHRVWPFLEIGFLQM